MSGGDITAEQLELSFMSGDATTSDKETAAKQPGAPKTKKARANKGKTPAAAKRTAKGVGKGKQTRKPSAKNKKPSKQQRPYPHVSFEKALQVAAKIKQFNGGNPWPPAEVAKAINMGPKSPGFFYVTTASRDFGITTGTRDTPLIELTQLGREIVYPPNPTSEAAKKKTAFLNVKLFADVLKHYKGEPLPTMQYLGNTLLTEFKLAEEHHEEFARVFRDNCKYLGITKGDVAEGPTQDSGGTVVVGETKSTKLKAFVIMPFVERNESRAEGFFKEVLDSLIIPAGLKAGFNVETAMRQGSDVIQSTIINEILAADLVIADLTDHNPNVLFELGLRMGAEEKKPIALIKAKGTGRLFDIDNMLRVWEYRPELWKSTIEADTEALTQHIEGAWTERDKVRPYLAILRNPPPVTGVGNGN
jgi:hypothetical protein